ncbi:hypothetical protein HMPREF1545_00724 [Oscillibacter sp. KLE 1728]|nr:hypothetical protein HMPREF1545_00724 [Oscillibacter sp. KLE 1728]
MLRCFAHNSVMAVLLRGVSSLVMGILFSRCSTRRTRKVFIDKLPS